MSVIAALNEADKHRLCRLLSIHGTPYLRGLKRVNDEGRIVGAVGLDQWAPNSVQCHIWLEDASGLTRHFLHEIFTYIFVTCGVGIAIGVTPCNNEPALELNRRMGFREVYRLKDGFSLGTDSAIQVMRREECRWIDREVRSGQKLRAVGT